MKNRLLLLLSFAVGVFSLQFSSDASNPITFIGPDGATLYGANGSSAAAIFEVDPETGDVSNQNTADPASEIFSLSTQPGTNTVYCVYKEMEEFGTVGAEFFNSVGFGQNPVSLGTPVSLGPPASLGTPVSLGTIDPATGEITWIADFSLDEETVYDGIPGITFDCDGNLYAVSGGKFPDENQQTPTGIGPGPIMVGPGLIFSVDPETAELTFIAEGGQGGAQNLEFNPEDGLLYHFFSDKGAGLETVDPVTGDIVSVPLTGNVYVDGIQAVVFAGEGQFLGHQDGGDSFYVITSSGEVDYVGPSPTSPNYKIRGLAYSKAIGCAGYQPDLLIGKGASKLKKDDFYTKTGRQQTIRGVKLAGRVGSSIEIPLEVQNDGSVRDRIRLRWSITNLNRPGDQVGTGPRFRRQVFLDGKNVTASIRQKGLALDPGEKQRLKFKLSVEREPARRVSKRSATFRAISRNDSSKTDVGKSIITVKK